MHHNIGKSRNLEQEFENTVKYDNSTKVERLYRCNAKVYTLNSIRYLVSYSTLVAILDEKTGICSTLAEYYSNTTTQHIYKFARKYNADGIMFLNSEQEIVRTVIFG